MRPRSRSDFAIAIICALPLEADAVEALFDEHYDRLGKYYGKQQGDANAYINGRIGKHDVVLCYMPGMGKGSAARVMSSLQVSYTSTKLALVVGICGGAPSSPENEEIFLGNVIISDSVVEYDFGRQYPGGFQRKVKDTLGRPGREIRTLLNGLRAKSARKELGDQTRQYLHILQQREAKWCHPGLSDILFEASYLHKHYCHASPARCSCFGSDQICEEALGKDCDDLNCDKGQQIRCREASEAIPTTIYIGPVASADTVMKSGQHRDEIIRNEKVIGFEMEGAGVWDDIPCIIIKGVCDYADSHKNKLWQAYAAATGASAAKAFLGYWMPANHKDTGQNRHLMIPFARNPHFMGRQEEIQKIEELISKPNGPKKLAITGLGGVGKTQIALELVYRMREREPECSIFWIPCTSYEAVEQACMTIAQMVGIHDIEPAKVKERLKAYFSQINKKWILIFDNADEMDMWINGSPTAQPLKNIIPRSENGHVLFTSRNRKLALQLASSVLPIPDVDQQTAKEIFRNLLIRKDLLQDNHITYALLEQLAFLPLAISQAAAYINQNDISLARYMSLLNEQEGSIIELLSEEFMDDGRYTEIQNTVATTWLVSFTQIQQVDEVASDYLSFMACISPRDIPESILPSTASAKRKVEALGLLKAYSFVSVHVDDSVLSLHRLVHLVTRNWLRKRETFEWSIERAAEQLDKTFPNSNHSNRQIWRDYLPHALYLVDSEEFQRDNHDDFLARLGSCLENDGRYAEAETLFLDVLKVQERACGPEDPDTLTSVSQLGSVLARQGKYKEAEVMQRRALQGYEKGLGPEHPDTLTSVSRLGTVLAWQGKYEEAEAMHRQALQGREKVLGPEHPDTLTSVSQLGSVLADQGKYEEAEAMHRRDLAGSEKVLGPEHPDTLTSVGQLGSVLAWQGKYKEAEAMQRRALQGYEKVLGPEHPDTLTSVSQLGSVLADQGKYEEAEAMQRRALQGYEKVLGPEHPDTLTSVSQLGSVLADQGKYEEAEAMHRQALQGREKVLGPEHPDTLISVSQLGSVLARQGKYEEAEIMHRRDLAGSEKVLGPEHPDTLTSVGQLGSVLAWQGKYKEAEVMHRRDLAGSEKVLGPEHPGTLTSVSQLGSVLARQGKYKEAEAIHRQALQGREKVLGPEHPDTLTSVSRLGTVLAWQGKYEEAEAMHRQALQGREKVLGPEHPDTLTSISQLGSVLADQGKYEEAEAMHRRDLAGSEKVLGPEHPDTLTSMANLAIMYFKQEHLKEAEELETRVLEIRKRVLGPEHPDTLTSMSNHAFTMKQLGNISDALSLIKKCADLRNKVLGSDHPHAISSSNALRNWETASKQFSESQKQHASTDNPPTLTLVHTYAGDDIASSKPAGRKRRAFMNFFRRGPSL